MTLGAAIVLLMLVGLAFALRFWPRLQKSRIPLGRENSNPVAKELFLQVDYCAPEKYNDVKRGYLRSLTLDRASIVAQDRNIVEGSHLDVIFDSAKSSEEAVVSDDHHAVTGKVVKKKSLGGSPESWLIDVRFQDRNDQADGFIRDYMQKAIERRK